MGLEAMAYVADFVITNPPNTDSVSQGDDHIRGMKTAIKASLPKDLKTLTGAGLVTGRTARYDGTNIVLTETEPVGLVITRDTSAVLTNGVSYPVSFTNELLDSFSMWAIGSPTAVVAKTGFLRFRAYANVAVHSDAIANGGNLPILLAWLVNGTSVARTPFPAQQFPFWYDASAGYYKFRQLIDLGEIALTGFPGTAAFAWPNNNDQFTFTLTGTTQGGGYNFTLDGCSLILLPIN